MLSQGNDLYLEAKATDPFTIFKSFDICSLDNNVLFRLCKNGQTQESENAKGKKAKLGQSPFLSLQSLYHVCEKRSESKRAMERCQETPRSPPTLLLR